jgi:pimeloyl-ACP methyl ester carboxylesterase
MASGHAFARHTAQLSRGPLDYFVAGEGRDAIYLHAAAGLEIRSVPERLARSFRVWVPIVPGYEGTPILQGVDSIPAVADLVAELIDSRMQAPCDVAGHSMGARLAAWLAIQHPGKVDQLALMAPAGFRPAGAPPLAFDPETMVKQLYAHPERRPEPKPLALLEGNRAAMRHYGVGQPRDEALAARIGEIQALTLVLQGTEDVRVPPEAVQEIKSRVKNAQLVYVYDAAHALEVDQPERVAALVHDFFQRGEVFIVNTGGSYQRNAAAVSPAAGPLPA